MRVSTKREAYRLAAAGLCGNTVERFFSLPDWIPHMDDFPTWGVQTTKVPGGPCRLNCPTAEVAATFAEYREFDPVISAMISAAVPTLWAGDVWDGPTGVECHGLLHPPLGFNWRALMLKPTSWFGLAAKTLLRTVLNGNGQDDLADLMEKYPGHVYEISVFDRCVGKLPHRNYVCWEIRTY